MLIWRPRFAAIAATMAGLGLSAAIGFTPITDAGVAVWLARFHPHPTVHRAVVYSLYIDWSPLAAAGHPYIPYAPVDVVSRTALDERGFAPADLQSWVDARLPSEGRGLAARLAHRNSVSVGLERGSDSRIHFVEPDSIAGVIVRGACDDDPDARCGRNGPVTLSGAAFSATGAWSLVQAVQASSRCRTGSFFLLRRSPTGWRVEHSWFAWFECDGHGPFRLG